MAIRAGRSLSPDRVAISAGLLMLTGGLSRVRSHRPRLLASWSVWGRVPSPRLGVATEVFRAITRLEAHFSVAAL